MRKLLVPLLGWARLEITEGWRTWWRRPEVAPEAAMRSVVPAKMAA